MHDFAITQDHAIFLDCPLVFKPDVSTSLLFCFVCLGHVAIIALLQC